MRDASRRLTSPVSWKALGQHAADKGQDANSTGNPESNRTDGDARDQCSEPKDCYGQDRSQENALKEPAKCALSGFALKMDGDAERCDDGNAADDKGEPAVADADDDAEREDRQRNCNERPGRTVGIDL
jgi:hypothetical protein